MWKVVDGASSSSEANKETMRPIFVRSNGQLIDTDSIKSREEIGKVDFPKGVNIPVIFFIFLTQRMTSEKGKDTHSWIE